MSVFDPVDVREPGSRRAQLLQRLTQQRQEQRKGRPLEKAAGSVRSGVLAPGRGFKNALDFRGVPKVRQTHRNNILPAILAALGAGQNRGRDEELSDNQGHEVAPPPPPVPLPPTPPTPIGPPPPPPPPVEVTPLPAPTPEAPLDNPDLTQTVEDVWHDIHLGGGMWYSPNQGITYYNPHGLAEF
jgi:hypothetical protein